MTDEVGSVPLTDWERHLGTSDELLCTQSATDLWSNQPRCGKPAIAIVHIGSNYAVCRRHMRRLRDARILMKTDTGSLAAVGPDRLWRRVGQTWYNNELDDSWHKFRRLDGLDGTATYHALMADPTLTYPCDFAPLIDAEGRTATRNEWVCEGDRKFSSDAQRSRGITEHPPSFSAAVPCSSPEAMVLLGPTVRDAEVGILACQDHTDWLYDHIYVDGAYSGVMARRETGRWVTAFAQAKRRD